MTDIEDTLVDAVAKLDWPLDPDLTQEGDYVEMSSEFEGYVVFRRKGGSPFMWMPLADYETLKRNLQGTRP